MNTRVLALLVPVTVLAVPAAAQAVVGGFDSSRTRSLSGSQYSILYAELNDPANFGPGGVSGPLVFAAETPILDAAYLADKDIVWLGDFSPELSASEQAAIAGWHAAGGTIIMTTDSSPGATPPNSVLAALGANAFFTTTNCGSSQTDGVVGGSADSPAAGPFQDLRGVAGIGTSLTVEITLDAASEALVTCAASGAVHTAWYPPGAVNGAGSGAVVFAGDPLWLNLFTDPASGLYGVASLDFGLNVFALAESIDATNYCGPAVPNSTGNPGFMSAAGSNAVAANDLTLAANDLPDGSFAYFIGSRTQGFQMNPGGSQGNICLSGQVARFVLLVGQVNGGTYSRSIDLTSIPEPPTFSVAVMPGDTWNFQCWHRDANPSVTSNFTDAIEIPFQ